MERTLSSSTISRSKPVISGKMENGVHLLNKGKAFLGKSDIVFLRIRTNQLSVRTVDFNISDKIIIKKIEKPVLPNIFVFRVYEMKMET